MAVAHIPPTNSETASGQTHDLDCSCDCRMDHDARILREQVALDGVQRRHAVGLDECPRRAAAVAVLTIRLLTGDRMQRFWHRGALAAMQCSRSLVICGYWRSWAWTGWMGMSNCGTADAAPVSHRAPSSSRSD